MKAMMYKSGQIFGDILQVKVLEDTKTYFPKTL